MRDTVFSDLFNHVVQELMELPHRRKVARVQTRRQARRLHRARRQRLPRGESISLRLASVSEVHNTPNLKVLIGLQRINAQRRETREPFRTQRASIC